MPVTPAHPENVQPLPTGVNMERRLLLAESG